jgi:hypothetical protein
VSDVDAMVSAVQVGGFVILAALIIWIVMRSLFPGESIYQPAPPAVRDAYKRLAPPRAVDRLREARGGYVDPKLALGMMLREVRREGFAEFANLGGQVQPRRGARGVIVGIHTNGCPAPDLRLRYVVQWTRNISSRYSYGLHAVSTTICPIEDLHVMTGGATPSGYDIPSAAAAVRKLVGPGEQIIFADGTLVEGSGRPLA